jgi:voltage-gated potassium channel
VSSTGPPLRSGEVPDGTLSTPYELFNAALTVVSIVNSVLVFLPLSSKTRQVVLLADAFFSLIFLVDFAYRLFRARSRRTYFFKLGGWLDLLGSLPLPLLRVLRMFRVRRTVETTSVRGILRELFRRRAESAVLLVILLVLVAAEYGALAVLAFERHYERANIRSGGDALWWAYVTMTTVGYGDKYPISPGGRAVGVVMMTLGLALFGTLTGYLANSFSTRKTPSRRAGGGPSDDVADLRDLVQQQQRLADEVLERLDRLERAAAARPSPPGDAPEPDTA